MVLHGSRSSSTDYNAERGEYVPTGVPQPGYEDWRGDAHFVPSGSAGCA